MGNKLLTPGYNGLWGIFRTLREPVQIWLYARSVLQEIIQKCTWLKIHSVSQLGCAIMEPSFSQIRLIYQGEQSGEPETSAGSAKWGT